PRSDPERELVALQTGLTDVHATTNNDLRFVNTLGTAFSAFFDVQLAASGQEHVFWIREDQGFWAGSTPASMRYRFITQLDGNVYAAGRIRGVFIWDGTTLKSWLQPVGSSIVQEFSATSW